MGVKLTTKSIAVQGRYFENFARKYIKCVKIALFYEK